MTTFEAVSLRIGELRLEEVALQIGEVESFTVLALDVRGFPVVMPLRFTSKWGGSWQRVLECPRCTGPARVLSVTPEGAACGKCRPRRTRQQQKKRSAEWQAEGKIADQLLRAVLAAPLSTTPIAPLRELARKVARYSTTRARTVAASAAGVMARIDREHGER